MSRRKWTLEELRKAVKTSTNMSATLRKLRLSVRQGNYITIQKYIDEHGLDTSHWQKGKPSYRVEYNNPNELSVEEVFVEGSTYVSSNNLKKKALKHGLLENKCYECGLIKEWNEKPIVMVMDHKNGIRNDHRIENLRLLCPNCNSQLPTHCGKNKDRVPKYYCEECEKLLDHKRKSGLCVECYREKRRSKIPRICSDCNNPISRNKGEMCPSCASKKRRKVKRPTKEVLAKDIDNLSWLAIGRKYGVSDNAVRKWARSYGLIE